MSNKQYYTNLNPNEKVIENRFGSKVVMDNSGNVLLTTSRRTEYIDQLRQENYQGDINLNPDEEGSFFYVGTGQIDINQQGNINQDSLPQEPQPDAPAPLDEPAIGLYSTYSEDNGAEIGAPLDLRFDTPTEQYINTGVTINNYTADRRRSLLKNKYPSNIIGSNVFTQYERKKLTQLAEQQLDIFNPLRITQPFVHQNDYKAPRPYYTEFLAESQYRNKGDKSTPISPFLSPSLVNNSTNLNGLNSSGNYISIFNPQHKVSQLLWDTLIKYSNNRTTVIAESFLAQGTDEVPWSAFFISWLVNQVDLTFPSGINGSSHYKYATEKKSPKWELFPLPYYDDTQNKDASGKSLKIKIDIGDILISPRGGGAGSSHGDMVYKIEKNKAYLVGGNVDDTVMITPVNIDNNGYYLIDQPYRKLKADGTALIKGDEGFVTYLIILKKVKI
jgi:hypothetical protein